ACATRFVGPLDLHLAVGDHHPDTLSVRALKLPLGPLDLHQVVLDLDGHPLGYGDWQLTNSGHAEPLTPYQTSQRTSPPLAFWRASRSVIRPLEVDRIATPKPLRTLGMSVWRTY